MALLKVGCCGFPNGLKNYFSRFKVVEVQKTFYQLPTVETAKKWRSLAPTGFEFAVKAWQGITHPVSNPTYKRFRGKLFGEPVNYGFFRQTEEVFKAWMETEKVCSTLKARYVLFQCPASFKPTDENIENITIFFRKVRNPGFRFVWEPRGKEWTDEKVSEVCKKCDLIHGVDPFGRQPVTRETAYFRLHGSPPGKRMYYYDYTEKDLKKLLEWCEPFEQVYCFFNNMSMFENALRFMRMVSKKDFEG
ncbi:MAG: DUF72 domain-containing protein [Thermoplasmata archaeon]|nr:MAG: DUF72 domain-containing protein [Thermoplasmata archaeon]